jgi:hypothetical protein
MEPDDLNLDMWTIPISVAAMQVSVPTAELHLHPQYTKEKIVRKVMDLLKAEVEKQVDTQLLKIAEKHAVEEKDTSMLNTLLSSYEQESEALLKVQEQINQTQAMVAAAWGQQKFEWEWSAKSMGKDPWADPSYDKIIADLKAAKIAAEQYYHYPKSFEEVMSGSKGWSKKSKHPIHGGGGGVYSAIEKAFPGTLDLETYCPHGCKGW